VSTESGLPLLVERYLDRALRDGPGVARQVVIAQKGEMFKKPGARAMRFTAIERFAVDEVAFSWEARFPVVSPLSLKVTDSLAPGHGKLTVRALGFPLQTQSGPELTIGEAYRYLAELPWVPHAMAMNPELRWREIDERAVEVQTTVGTGRPAVRLEFDETGDVVRCVADARPGTVGGRSVTARWGGELSDYDTLGGIRMPTRGAVYWDLPEGRFTYWRGQITSAQTLEEPHGRSAP
jgi:hypothetical protein